MLVIHLKNWMNVCESICQTILDLLQRQKMDQFQSLGAMQKA